MQLLALGVALIIALEPPQPVPVPTPTRLDQLAPKWQRLALCESSGQLHAVSRSRTYHGLWQLHKGFYAHFHIKPETATLAQQYRIAQYVYKRQGAKAWSCAKKARFK